MNKQLRRLGLGLLVCYLVLFVQLNWLQVAKAKSYNADPRNTREVVKDFSRPRGSIISRDGVVLAKSEPSNDRWGQQRVYPLAELFGHPVGVFSFQYGTSGIEQQYNDVLTGKTAQQQLRSIGNIFSNKQITGDVFTTLDTRVQQAARDALGDKIGSAVVLDPRDGSILAMWSNPAIDPNRLASHDFEQAKSIRDLYLLDERKPLLDNAYQERYAPGSTFKVLTITAGLESGKVDPNTAFPPVNQYIPPLTTTPIKNFGGETCGGTLFQVFYRSCNTSFAQLAVQLGAQTMVDTINNFGYNEAPPIDLPNPAKSNFGTLASFERNDPKLAQSGFGANEVQGTPLEEALVAAGVANGGKIMTPHVMSETRDNDGGVLQRYQPSVWKTPMKPETSTTITQAMVEVVKQGTARCCMQLADGVQAAAKTGTAQLNFEGQASNLCPGSNQCSHAWIVSFAPADHPRVAVAIFVRATPEVSSGVGGTVAGPVARQILDATLPLVPA